MNKNELLTELYEIEKREREEIAEKNLPELKNKYEGKYFKKVETGSNFRTYTRVDEIAEVNVLPAIVSGILCSYTGYWFSITNSGIEVNSGKNYVDGVGDEISRSEFDNAWHELVDKIASVIVSTPKK